LLSSEWKSQVFSREWPSCRKEVYSFQILEATGGRSPVTDMTAAPSVPTTRSYHRPLFQTLSSHTRWRWPAPRAPLASNAWRAFTFLRPRGPRSSVFHLFTITAHRLQLGPSSKLLSKQSLTKLQEYVRLAFLIRGACTSLRASGAL
jgi:hypothetical protein